MLKYIKEILKVALPAVGEMVLYMLIWVFDTMMVGNYGGQLGVSAVALSSELLYTFINILMGMGLSIALTSIIARTMGNKNISLAQNYANQGINRNSYFFYCYFYIFYFCRKYFKCCKCWKRNSCNFCCLYENMLQRNVFLYVCKYVKRNIQRV